MQDPAVLHLGLTWHDAAPGGLNRYLADLQAALAAAGVCSQVLVEGPASCAPPGVTSVGASTVALPSRIKAWSRAVRQSRCDVVDVHFALSAYGPIVLGGLRGRPLVCHFHGPWSDESRAAGTSGLLGLKVKHRIERTVLRRAARVVVLSGAFKQILVDDHGLPPDRIEVISPGVDDERFSPGDRLAARAELGWAPDGPVAFTVRRLVPRMGIDVLLRAWTRLPPEALLAVAGDGAERSALERLRDELGLTNRVRFLGRVDDRTLAQCYRAADVVVVPTIELEGFGLVAAEALACGTPVIASRVGGLPDALGGLPTDLLVPPADPAALGGRLVDAFSGARPLPTSEECLAVSERFRWSRVVDEHRRIYREVAHPAERAARRLRVVYVDHAAVLSGAELALLRLIPAVPEVDAHVILGTDGPLADALRAAGVSVEVLELGGVGRRSRAQGAGPLGAIALAPATIRLAGRLRELRPDLVHTNSLKANLYGGVAARLAGIPAVWHQHDRLSDDYLPEQTAATIRRIADIVPAAVIACSEAALRTVQLRRRRGWSVPSPGAVVPITIRPRPRGNDGPLVVGSMSRLAEWKGQHVLIEAFASAFGGDGHDEQLVIHGEPLFGEDSYVDRLRADVDRLGLAGRVRFPGFAADVPAALAELDVLVHSSVIPEPFGQVVPEGMAAGLAVVASDAGGPAEVVTHDEDGLLVPPGDAVALADALRRLAGDPDLRHRIGTAAQVTSTAYTAEVIGPQVRAVYDAVLAGRR